MNIVYIRTSTEDQSPKQQLNNISELIDLQNCVIYEEKQSAWSDYKQRDKFEEIRYLIKKGKVTAIYVWDLDRLYRDRKKLKGLFELCKAYQTKIFSYNQQWLSDVSNTPYPWNEVILDLLINVMGWIAEEESSKKSERVKKAVKKTSKGTYSYNGNRWGRKPLPKQTIDKILQSYDEGQSIRKIAASVTTTDKNNNQKKIGKSTVHKILVENSRVKPSS